MSPRCKDTTGPRWDPPAAGLSTLNAAATVIFCLLTAVTAHTQPRSRGGAPGTQPTASEAVGITRLQYSGGGDWYWGPSAIDNLLDFVDDHTNIPVDRAEYRIKPADPKIVFHPFVYATGHGNIRFTDDEALNMRRYLLGGGFWFINDSYGMDESVRRSLKKVFPDRDLVELPFSHPIYHTVFGFPNGLPKIHEHDNNPPRGYAVLDGERVCVFYAHESDIGDGWEDPQVHGDPPQKREAALRMGTNILAYALTH